MRRTCGSTSPPSAGRAPSCTSAVPCSSAPTCSPRLFQEFREQNPQITLTLTEGSSTVLLDKLLERRLDFFLEAEPLQDPKIQSVAWATEEIVLAVPPGSPSTGSWRSTATPSTLCSSATRPGCKKPPVPLQAFREEPFPASPKGQRHLCPEHGAVPNAGFTPKDLGLSHPDDDRLLPGQ